MSLALALLVALTVCLISILSSTFISREFEAYVKLAQKKQADDLAESIGSHYDEAAVDLTLIMYMVWECTP